MKNNKRIIASFALLSLLFSGCSFQDLLFWKKKSSEPEQQQKKEEQTPETPDTPETPEEPEVQKDYFINPVSPLDEETVVLSNDDVKEFIKNYTFGSSSEYIKDYNHYESVRSLSLSWNIKENANYYVVEFAKKEDLSDANYYLTNETTVEIDDVYPGYTYHWRVNAYYDTRIVRSYTFKVYTASMPTTIYLESVGNLRDLGGIVTTDGKRIKNGVVYRGANADGVSDSDKSYMINDLGIKTDLDLRNKNEGLRNKIGAQNCYEADDNGGFYYNNYPNGVSYPAGQQVLVKELKYFANKDNYPIYFHCAIGRDRTGSLALVLLALLGVSKKNICIDYELSMFATVSTSEIRGGTVTVLDLLNQLAYIYNYIYGGYSGSSMKEKTENFLLEIGLTQNEIDSIRSNMLEEI